MNKPQIHPLTSLRFFAAAMIVVLHSTSEVFGLPRDFLGGFPLDEGVGLFFVLSGFIMIYVYPELPTRRHTTRFLRSRFARVWPLHVFTLLAVFLVLPVEQVFMWDTGAVERGAVIASHLALVQSWIPFMNFYWGGNGLAWSVSTEFFFYLVFPFLVRNFRNSWAWKLLLVYFVWLLIFTACRFLDLPGYRADYLGVTTVGLLYVNPLARLPEFVTGMVAGMYFMRLAEEDRLADLPARTATVLEVTAVVLAFTAMWVNVIWKQMAGDPLDHVVRLWIGNGGVCFFWAALVLVFAASRGALSRALCHQWLVRLGDISFAIYMCHEIMIRCYLHYGGREIPWSAWVQYPLFWVFLLAVSYALWAFVETPARRALAGR